MMESVGMVPFAILEKLNLGVERRMAMHLLLESPSEHCVETWRLTIRVADPVSDSTA